MTSDWGEVWSSGHTVLAVAAPPLEDFVLARTRRYDPSFVSNDPRFAHAHITVLAPWIPSPTAYDLEIITQIAGATAAFDITVAEVGMFANGTIHLAPTPAGPLCALTSAVTTAFPAYVPYAGRYGPATPHLTLDRASAEVTIEGVRADVAHLLPATWRVDRLDLQWWANDDCRVVASWPLGGSEGRP